MKNRIIGNCGYIFIIVGMIVGEKVSTNAAWVNIIKSEFWQILFIVIIGIIAETLIKILIDK